MKKIIAVIVSVGLVSGCSAFRSRKQSISIMTNQPDATIFVNGEQVGRGNVQTSVKRNRNVQIMASKPGYQTAYRNIDCSFNTTGILDIIGTIVFLWPLIGVLSPGSKSLDENNVALNLDPIAFPTAHQ